MTRERFSKVTEAALSKLQGEHLLAHIYIALTLHGAPGKECWPSVKAIADLIGGNRYRTALGIKKLEELGLVSPVRKVGQQTVWMICKIEKSSDTSSATSEKTLVTPQVAGVTPQVPLSDTSGATNIQRTDKEQTSLSPKLKAKNKKLRRWMSQEDSDRWDAWLTYAVLELYGGMRSTNQDGITFRALEKVEKTGNDTQREMIRKKDFLLRVAKKADWPKPEGRTGRAGYGKRFEIVLPQLLEGIEGKQDALIRYQANLEKQKKEMKI